MIGLFIANPGPRGYVARSRRTGMEFNAWPEGGRGRTLAERRAKAHSVAARIGWAYRRDRKRGPAEPLSYLERVGLSRRALRAYRMARKTPAARLLEKRMARSRRTGRPRVAFIQRPFLVNDPRHEYREFMKRYLRRARIRSPQEARQAMREGAALWRAKGKVAANELPGVVYYDDNPLYRAPSGRFVGRPVPGARPLRRLPGRYGGWRNEPGFNDNPRGYIRHPRYGLIASAPWFVHRKIVPARRAFEDNPILPTMAWDDNARRRRRLRRYDDNAILPYGAFNPESEDNPVEAVGEALETTFSVDFWSDTVLPMGAGFVGGQFVGGLVYGLAEKVLGDTVKGSGFVPSLARVGSRAIGSAGVSALAFFVTKDRDVAGKVLAGGLVAVLAGIIQEIFGMDVYKKMTGMEGIEDVAADLTEELKKRIAESVRSEIRAAEAGAPAGVSAFVTTQDLAPAPTLGPGPRVGDMGAFVTAEEMQTAPVASHYGAPAGGPPVVADLSTFSDAFADMMLV